MQLSREYFKFNKDIFVLIASRGLNLASGLYVLYLLKSNFLADEAGTILIWRSLVIILLTLSKSGVDSLLIRAENTEEFEGASFWKAIYWFVGCLVTILITGLIFNIGLLEITMVIVIWVGSLEVYSQVKNLEKQWVRMRSLSSLCALGYLLVFVPATFKEVLYYYFVLEFFPFIFLLYKSRKNNYNILLKFPGFGLLKTSLFLSISSASIILYSRSDIFILKFHNLDSIIVDYSIITRYVEASYIVLSSYLYFIFPKMKIYSVSDLTRKVKEVLIISSAVTILLLTLSSFYLDVFSATNSLKYLIIFLLIIPIVYLSSLLSRWLLIIGLDKILVKKSLVVLTINIVVGVLLTGRLQIWGVILGTLSAEMVGLVILWRHAK